MSNGENDNMELMKKKSLKIEYVINAIASVFSTETRNKIRYYEISEDLFVWVLITGNKAKIITDFEIIDKIIIQAKKLESLFKEKNYKDLEILHLTNGNAKTILKTLANRQEVRHQSKIKTIAFKSDECVAFHRLKFDISDIPKPTPNWNILLSNFTNVSAVKMFIGSLFVEDSDRAQYLWLYGKGGNGKSTLAKVLSKSLGEFVRFEQAPPKDDKYWTYGLLGRRLIVLDDCNHYGFVKTGLFKSLTGSSKVRVERKFGDPNDADLNCKFLFTSNEKPAISNDTADQRRIIFSSAKNQESFSFDKDFVKNLISELNDFLIGAVNLYLTHCEDGRPIPTDNSEALELAAAFDEEIEAWLDQNFEYDPNSRVLISDFLNMLSVSPIKGLNKRRLYDYLELKNVSKIRCHAGRALQGLKQKVYFLKNN
jgi:hypothetical protein